MSSGKKERLNKNIFFKKVCISDTDNIKKILIENNISVVVHLAGKINAHESQKYKKEYFKTNYFLSRKLYEAVIKSNVKKFIFASTAAVYGDYKRLFKETDKNRPINNYGSSKLKFEKYLNTKKKISHVILRFFNVTGNYFIKSINKNKNDSVILKLYKAYKKKNKTFYISINKKKESTRRDFIHVIDLIRIIEESIYDKRKHLTLNCGYGKSISISEIVNEFEKKYNKRFKKIYKNKKSSDPFEVIADTSRLKKIFKFSANYNSSSKIISKIKSVKI